MKDYTVKEVASLLGKHEETIKRWIRSGKLPHAFINSDKKGWRIPESDLLNLNNGIQVIKIEQHNEGNEMADIDETELVKLAYEAVTLTSPSDDILTMLSIIGIKRTLEILLIMQQSPTKVKNPDGFIKKAIRENWNPNSVPIKLPKKQSKRIYELTQQDYNHMNNHEDSNDKPNRPFYNWLEED